MATPIQVEIDGGATAPAAPNTRDTITGGTPTGASEAFDPGHYTARLADSTLFAVPPQGGGAAHNTMQPFAVVGWLIKT